jgi:hypothetical protein
MESPEVVSFPPPRSLTQTQLLYNRQHIIDLLSKGKLGDHFHGVSLTLYTERISVFQHYILINSIAHFR